MSKQSDLVKTLNQSRVLLELAIEEIDAILKGTALLTDIDSVVSKSGSSLERLRIEIQRRLIQVKPALSDFISEYIINATYDRHPELRGK